MAKRARPGPARGPTRAPRIKVTADSDLALERDPQARVARLPHEVFELIRAALPQGPVLVQVPRSGYPSRWSAKAVGSRPAAASVPARPPPTRVRCRPAPGVGARRRTGVPDLWLRRSGAGGRCPYGRGAGPGVPPDTGPAVGRRRTVGQVPDTPAIVVATPGAEPSAEGGYSGAVLLDTPLLLLRPDLRAAEEALRRWLNVVALVRAEGTAAP